MLLDLAAALLREAGPWVPRRQQLQQRDASGDEASSQGGGPPTMPLAQLGAMLRQLHMPMPMPKQQGWLTKLLRSSGRFELLTRSGTDLVVLASADERSGSGGYSSSALVQLRVPLPICQRVPGVSDGSIAVRRGRLGALDARDIEWLNADNGVIGMGSCSGAQMEDTLHLVVGQRALSLIGAHAADTEDRTKDALRSMLGGARLVSAEAWRDVLVLHRMLNVAVPCHTAPPSTDIEARFMQRFGPPLPPCGGDPPRDASCHPAMAAAFMAWALATHDASPSSSTRPLDVRNCTSKGEMLLLHDAARVVHAQATERARLAVRHDVCEPTTTAAARQLSPAPLSGSGGGGVLELEQARYKTRVPSSTRVVRVHGACGKSAVDAQVKLSRGRRLLLYCSQGFGGVGRIGAVVSHDDGESRDARGLREVAERMLRGELTFAACPVLRALGAPQAAAAAGALHGKEARARCTSRPVRALIKASASGYSARQQQAIEAVLAPAAAFHCVVQLVRGPPGTGKTRVISEAAAMWCAYGAAIEPEWSARRQQHGRPPLMVCCARTNAAVVNIALALAERGLRDRFRLVVSREFHEGWHEHMYAGLAQQLVTSDQLQLQTRASSDAALVLVCTLSMLASDVLRCSALLQGRRVMRLLVDEASQVYVGDLLPLLAQLRPGVHGLCGITLFGDDRQLPPYGDSSKLRVRSAFDAHEIWAGAGVGTSTPAALTLDQSHRLPPLLCEFVSKHMYGGQLHVAPGRRAGQPGQEQEQELQWLDVACGEERSVQGGSFANEAEAAAVHVVAQRLHLHVAAAASPDGGSWRVLCMYDAQRHEIERKLAGLGSDRVYNVDTFQGREDDVIVVSVVRTRGLGFLRDDRRVNVMLTRCRRRLIVVGRLDTALRHPETLLGKLAMLCRERGLVVAA